ncbi:MAG: MFS transporter [Bacillota bacterium]|nr:MFS transporter [Bacillota bacterium]
MKLKDRDEHSNLFSLVLGRVFILNALFFFFQALTKNLFPPLLLPLRETFSIDNTQVGLLVTLVYFGYALARFPSGVLSDLYGCTKTALAGSILMALSFVAIALSPTYPVMALMTFILGLSSGIYVTAGYTLAVIIGSRERAATATAAFETFGIVAGLISPLLVTFFVLYFNWSLLFVVSGLFLGLVTILFYRVRSRAVLFETEYAADNAISSSDRGTAGDGSSIGKREKIYSQLRASSAVFLDPRIRKFIIWSTLVGGLGALSWTGINSFIPTFLVENRNYTYEVANQIFIIVSVAGLLAKVATGWLADRFGNNPVLFTNLSVSVVLFMALSFVANHWLLLLILALLGAACLNTNTLINSYVLRSMPPRYQGAGFGFFSTAYTVIYSMGPYLTGFFSDLFGLSRAIQLSSFGAVAAAVLILAADRFIPRRLVETLSER